MEGEVVNDQTPWGRNPFLTEEEVTGKRESKPNEYLQVKSIILGPPQSVATVNGQTVVVGEYIGEETVKEIRPEGVVLEKRGHERLLRVRQPSISIEVNEGKK